MTEWDQPITGAFQIWGQVLGKVPEGSSLGTAGGSGASSISGSGKVPEGPVVVTSSSTGLGWNCCRLRGLVPEDSAQAPKRVLASPKWVWRLISAVGDTTEAYFIFGSWEGRKCDEVAGSSKTNQVRMRNRDSILHDEISKAPSSRNRNLDLTWTSQADAALCTMISRFRFPLRLVKFCVFQELNSPNQHERGMLQTSGPNSQKRTEGEKGVGAVSLTGTTEVRITTHEQSMFRYEILKMLKNWFALSRLT